MFTLRSSALLFCLLPIWARGEILSLPTSISVGNGVEVMPHFHTRLVTGSTTGDAEAMATAHHDPAVEGFTLQSIEPGLSVRLNENVNTFVTGGIRWDDAEGWINEFEEGMLVWKNLPGGFDVRAGQFFNKFGINNFRHQHGWDFVTQHLALGRFLGLEGLVTQGAEVQWNLPVKSITTRSILTASYGHAPSSDHAHGDEHHEEGEEEEHHEGETEEEHAEHAGEEIDGDAFGGNFLTVNWTNEWRNVDQHVYRGGLSAAFGENRLGADSLVLGIHGSYTWRENGLEPGGRALRWENEGLWRQIETDEATYEELGAVSSVVYSHIPSGGGQLDTALRVEWVQGLVAAELDERFRITTGLTYWFKELRPTNTSNTSVRLQYSFDDSSARGQDHSIWLQVGFDWGRMELR
jgi:hypothetical protein